MPKLDARGKLATFVGYSEMSKAYRLLDAEKNKIAVTQDVKFDESDMATGKNPVFTSPNASVQIEQSFNIGLGRGNNSDLDNADVDIALSGDENVEETDSFDHIDNDINFTAPKPSVSSPPIRRSNRS